MTKDEYDFQFADAGLKTRVVRAKRASLQKAAKISAQESPVKAEPAPPDDSSRFASVVDLPAVLQQIEIAYGREYLGDAEAEHGYVPPNLQSDEQVRIDRLRAIYHDPRGPCRPLLFGSDALRSRLDTVRQDCPAFTAIVDLIDRSVALSERTGAPVSIPPILVAGPPGIGKTHFAKTLAASLGVAMHSLQFSTNGDAQQLVSGHPTSWRGARMGVMTEALYEGDTASPVFLGDEIDKLVTHWSEKPYNVLLNVFEPENSRALLDEYLRVPFNLAHSIFLATANDVSILPDFLVDRLLVFEISPPTGKQLIAVARLICQGAVAELQEAVAMPSDQMLARLARVNPRRIARIVRLAFGYAAAAGRDHLRIDDVDAANTISGEPDEKLRIGFLPSQLPAQEAKRARLGRNHARDGQGNRTLDRKE